MTPRSKFFWISNFVLALIFVGVVAFAWNNPPGNPPTGSGAIATDASNNVGVGESAPSARLHIKAAAAVAGAGTVSSAGTTVTGSGSTFTTQLKVGDSILAAGQTRVVTAIASNISLTTNSSFSPVLGAGTAYTYQRAIASLNDDTGAQQLWVGATGQAGLGMIPASATRFGVRSNSTFRFPFFASMDDGRTFGINFPSAPADTVVLTISNTHKLSLNTGGSQRIFINPSGQVGIGADVPSGSLSRIVMVDPAQLTLPPNVATILSIGSTDGTTGGSSIRAKGTISGQIPDLTEYVKVVGSVSNYGAGDILEIDTAAPDLFKKSAGEYGKKLAGVVSRTGGFIMGEDGVEFDNEGKAKQHVQLALAGRVPVKVVGEVAIGDAITSSNISGVGMRAKRSGRVVGFALESHGGNEVGYVKILINPHYWIAE